MRRQGTVLFLNYIFKYTEEYRTRYQRYWQRLRFIHDGEGTNGGPQPVILQRKVQGVVFQENIRED